jgi:hypothetical protein
MLLKVYRRRAAESDKFSPEISGLDGVSPLQKLLVTARKHLYFHSPVAHFVGQ